MNVVTCKTRSDIASGNAPRCRAQMPGLRDKFQQEIYAVHMFRDSLWGVLTFG